MHIRRAILLLAVAFGAFSASALAQSPYPAGPPAPVPSLPDSARFTSYTLSGTTCACSVGFDLYGDGTDYQNWVEVWLNGVKVAYNDATYGWTITSATGGLSTLPRPITNAVLTFNNAQTGTVQIVGAQRPRRLTEFSENRGVAARDLNQAFNAFTAIERETWDRTADVTGRAMLAPPGETLTNLPSLASRQGNLLGFGSDGNPVAVSPKIGLGTVVGPASSTDGVFACFNGTTGALVKTCGLPTANLFIGNGSGVPAAVPMSGDCSVSSAGAITCTKTNGTSLDAVTTIYTPLATSFGAL